MKIIRPIAPILFLFLLSMLVLVIYIAKKVIKKENGVRPYNIILISIDTLRPDHMGLYGYKKNTTPQIDQWAKQAYVFNNVVTVVPSTYPSFVALMTGKHPFTTKRINVRDPLLSSEMPTLVKILRAQSYYTVSFVNSGWVGPSTGLNEGFNEEHFLDWNEYEDINGTAIVKRKDYIKNVIAASDWLLKNKQKKFFLWVHLMDPHSPYNPPDNLKCIHNTTYCDTLRVKSPAELEDLRNSYDGAVNGCSVSRSLSKETIGMFETLYDGEITYTDMLVGKILDAVRGAGLDKKSIILLYGDHGEGFDHDFFFDHGLLYQSNIRIPLMISLPTTQEGKVIDDLIDNTDILPSLLDILGIPKKNGDFDGISFARVFKKIPQVSISTAKRVVAYSLDTFASRYSAYDGQYKYIYSPSESSCSYKNQREELYDTIVDPQEEKNLISEHTQIGGVFRSDVLRNISTYNMEAYNNKKDAPSDPETLERLKSFGY